MEAGKAVSFALLVLGIGGIAFKPPDDFRTGLAIWRKPGATPDHAACATCHSPDGIELAAYNFDDADIRRRARVHLDESDTDAIVAFVHSIRARYNFAKLLDPNRDRPLQPAGAVLQGLTPEARDEAFGQELTKLLPSLFNRPILTEDQAKASAHQVLALDLSKVQLGIPLNRLSEDIAHGNEHASIAQWLPEVAPTVPLEHLADWYEAEDEYLADPTDERMRDLVALHKKLMGPPRALAMTVMAQIKYNALLVLQHRLRTGTCAPAGATYMAQDMVGPGMNNAENSFWDLGFFINDLHNRNAAGNGFTDDLIVKKRADYDLSHQLSDLRVAWIWLGWLSDQGMRRTLGDRGTRFGRWLSQSLWDDGPYAIHNVFAETRRQLVASFDKASWDIAPERQHLFWDYPGIRIGQRFIVQAPAAGLHRSLYMNFTANCMRMNLLLLKSELERTHTVWIRQNSRVNMEQITAFVEMADPAHKSQAEQLKAALLTLIASANEIPSE